MKKIQTIELSYSSFDTLQEYAASIGKAPNEVAAAIIDAVLVHYLAGKCSGLDAAKKIYSEK